MKIKSNKLFLPSIQYESRATCIEGYAYPNDAYNKQINVQGIHVLCLEDIAILGDSDLVDANTWMPVFGHQELPFFPPYVAKWYTEKRRQHLIYDLIKKGKTDLTCLKVDSVITVLHFNCHVYGHFLVEIIPKIFVLKEFFKTTAKDAVPPLAMPSNIKAWVKRYIVEIWPECNFVWFDPRKEFVAAKNTFVVAGQQRLQEHPGIAQYFLGLGKESGSVVKKRESLHFVMLKQFLGFGKTFDPSRKGRKILLARPKIHFSKRNIANFARLKKIAICKGYEVVEPKSFGSLQEQANFFSQCSVVLGEFTSALHNTVFCPSGTIVGCLNYRNHYQESIAAVIGHNLNYILPDSGPILRGVEQPYIISEQKFSKLIDDIEKKLNS